MPCGTEDITQYQQGIIVFASVMATLGLQVFARVRKATSLQVITQFFLLLKIGIMASVTRVKFLLMLYCRGFQNVIVRAYAQDHLFALSPIQSA